MPDLGAKYTDDQIIQMEKQLKSVYNQAYKDILQKQKDFNKKYEEKEAKYKEKVAKGQMSQEEFDAWKKGQVFQGEQWQNKKKDILNIIYNSNKIATDIVNGKTQNVFTFNANYMSYTLEHGAGVNFGFSLYDSATVVNLIKNDPQLLPKWKIDQPKDYTWNQKKLNRQISLGIIEGESLDKIATRFSDSLATQNFNKMRTFARTAMTGAQNSGRQISLNNAKSLGIKLKKEWMATLDNHTRINHILLDGQKVNTDDDFEVDGLKIRYPGDPQAVPAMTYNCRCTMVGDIEDYPATYDRYDNIDGKPIKNMTYTEWEAAKSKGEDISPVPLTYTEWEAAKKKSKSSANTIINGKDISAAWKRRPDKFDFEIDDVINAQGFDGLPRVVSQEEFDRAVEESGLYAQRVYSAQTEEALEAYRKELYGGKFYVDCSVGGADFGQGMYMSGDFTGKKVNDVMEDSDRYVAISKSRGNKYSFVEKMTLDKDSKIATYDSLLKEYQTESVSIQNNITSNVGHKLVENAVDKYGLNTDDRNFLLWGLNIPKEIEPFDVMKATKYSGDKKLINSIRNDISSKIKAEKLANPIISANGDMGIYGTMKGYDAINIEGQAANGASQVLVLNRTKLIIKGE